MKNLIRYSYTLLLAGICILIFSTGGCTEQDTNESGENNLPVQFRLPVKALNLADGDGIENLRLLICKTQEGIFFFNEIYSAGTFMPDENNTGIYGTIDLEIDPGLYDIVAIANGDKYKELLGKEGLRQEELFACPISPDNLVSGKDIVCERDLYPFPRIAYLKGVRIGNLQEDITSGQISIDGGQTWRNDLPVDLEHIFPKLNISIRKMTENELDRIRITSLKLCGIPLYSFLLPSVYDGNEFTTLLWFRNGTTSSITDGYLMYNNNEGITAEDLYRYEVSGEEQIYLPYGARNIILPEHLITANTNDPAYTFLEVIYDYESWNEEKETWNPPFENVTVEIPLETISENSSPYNLCRNNEYHILLTISQTADFEFKPFITIVAAGWEEESKGYFNAGNKGIEVEGYWTNRETDPSDGKIYMDMNEFVEYSFLFKRAQQEDRSVIRWKAVLSNPVHFRFEGTSEGYARAGEPCSFRVTPVNSSGESHSTKVYINIENGTGGTTQLSLDPENKYVIYQNPQ